MANAPGGDLFENYHLMRNGAKQPTAAGKPSSATNKAEESSSSLSARTTKNPGNQRQRGEYFEEDDEGDRWAEEDDAEVDEDVEEERGQRGEGYRQRAARIMRGQSSQQKSMDDVITDRREYWAESLQLEADGKQAELQALRKSMQRKLRQEGDQRLAEEKKDWQEEQQKKVEAYRAKIQRQKSDLAARLQQQQQRRQWLQEHSQAQEMTGDGSVGLEGFGLDSSLRPDEVWKMRRLLMQLLRPWHQDFMSIHGSLLSLANVPSDATADARNEATVKGLQNDALTRLEDMTSHYMGVKESRVKAFEQLLTCQPGQEKTLERQAGDLPQITYNEGNAPQSKSENVVKEFNQRKMQQQQQQQPQSSTISNTTSTSASSSSSSSSTSHFTPSSTSTPSSVASSSPSSSSSSSSGQVRNVPIESLSTSAEKQQQDTDQISQMLSEMRHLQLQRTEMREKMDLLHLTMSKITHPEKLEYLRQLYEKQLHEEAQISERWENSQSNGLTVCQDLFTQGRMCAYVSHYLEAEIALSEEVLRSGLLDQQPAQLSAYRAALETDRKDLEITNLSADANMVLINHIKENVDMHHLLEKMGINPLLHQEPSPEDVQRMQMLPLQLQRRQFYMVEMFEDGRLLKMMEPVGEEEARKLSEEIAQLNRNPELFFKKQVDTNVASLKSLYDDDEEAEIAQQKWQAQQDEDLDLDEDNEENEPSQLEDEVQREQTMFEGTQLSDATPIDKLGRRSFDLFFRLSPYWALNILKRQWRDRQIPVQEWFDIDTYQLDPEERHRQNFVISVPHAMWHESNKQLVPMLENAFNHKWMTLGMERDFKYKSPMSEFRLTELPHKKELRVQRELWRLRVKEGLYKATAQIIFKTRK